MNISEFIKLLPNKIKVKIIKGKSGCFIAEIPQYDISTEADSIPELQFNINDLLYAYFEIPKELQGKVWYQSEVKEKKELSKFSIPFNILVAPELHSQFCRQ